MNKKLLINSLFVTGDVSLILAKRSLQRFSGQHVPIDANVEVDLRAMASNAVERMRELDLREYEPDLSVDKKHEFMYIPASMISNYPQNYSNETVPGSADRLIDIDNDVITQLMDVASADMISAKDIQSSGFNMYALIIGNDPSDRTIFIRHTNPQKFAKPGNALFAFADTLKRFDKPIITFEPNFDIVISRHGLLVSDQSVFEKTFRDVQVLAALHSERVQRIAHVLPLDAKSAEILAECATKPLIARKLRAISENGHLAVSVLTVETIRHKSIGVQDRPRHSHR